MSAISDRRTKRSQSSDTRVGSVRRQQFATKISRWSFLLTLMLATLAGAVAGMWPELLDRRWQIWATIGITLVTVIIACLVFASRRWSTATGICILFWPALRKDFRDRPAIRQALTHAARNWHFIERRPPDDISGSDSILQCVEALRRSVSDAERSDQARLTLAILPGGPDHLAFDLGARASAELLGLNLDLWGRKQQPGGESPAEWGQLVSLSQAERDEMFTRSTKSITDLVEPVIVHVITPRRLPSPYHFKNGGTPHQPTEADAKRFVKETQEADESLPESYHLLCLSDLVDIRGIVDVACSLLNLSASAANPPRLRLNCGEVAAFALGTLLSDRDRFTLQRFDPIQKRWLDLREVGR